MPRCREHDWVYLLPGAELTHDGVLVTRLQHLNDYLTCRGCGRLGFFIHRTGNGSKQVRLIANEQIEASIRRRSAAILSQHRKEPCHLSPPAISDR